MSDVTIVTDNAEWLVAVGGVVNRDEPPPDGQWLICDACYGRSRPTPAIQPGERCACEQGKWRPDESPFTAEVREPWGKDNHGGTYTLGHGTVRVVDVHHAEDDLCGFSHWSGPWHRMKCPEFFPCHIDAEPGKWHYVCEPIDQGDDDE